MQLKYFIITCLYLFFYSCSFSQSASVTEKEIELYTYNFSSPNPIPDFSKIYPYFHFNGYTNKGGMKKWKMVEMENAYIKLWVTPEIGGKIWGAVEKSTGKEFIYFNHAVKFRDVAMRGPWTSGGLEFNFGVIGHAPSCSTPVDYFIRSNDDGSVSCFVGDIDWASHTRWYIEINLPKDKAYFTTHVVWDNPTFLNQSYYQWMNLGIKTKGNLEYVYPGNAYLGHDGKHFSWDKNDKGRELNWYDKNNFGSYKSYHVFGKLTDFYAAYWHDDDFGLGHYASYDDKPGKKIWIWGLSQQGMIWENLLTDTDGQYTEVQSGRLFNQAAEESSLTPFKNREFAPASTDEWTEYWFPIKQTSGLKTAMPKGSVNLIQQNNRLKILFCPNEKISADILIKNKNKIIYSKSVETLPMQVFIDSFAFTGNVNDLSINLNNEQIYSADTNYNIVKRPTKTPSTFNWNTAYGHFIKGKEFEKQRLYEKALAEYRASLKIEPYFIPSLNGTVALYYKKTDYDSALQNSLKALSIDTYDGEANLFYGLSSMARGDTSSALDGLSLATANISTRCAAYNALATIFINKNNYERAKSYAEKSLQFNSISSEAIQLKCLALRKLNLIDEEMSELNNLEKLDPLNHFIQFEKYCIDPSLENARLVYLTVCNEFPQETFLEYAIWYFNNKQINESLNILELNKQNTAITLIWRAYLLHLLNHETQAVQTLQHALNLDIKFVFPYRKETLIPLNWALLQSNNWKLKYYKGLILLNLGSNLEAEKLLNDCTEIPNHYVFYITRAKYGGRNKIQTEADIQKGLQLSSNEPQVVLFASKFYETQKKYSQSEKILSSCFLKDTSNYYVALQYAKILAINNKYKESRNVLEYLDVLPNEGATEGRKVWRVSNLGLAVNYFKNKNYTEALKYVDAAKQWNLNLGVGKPYITDERLENYIAMLCYKKLNKTTLYNKAKENILSYQKEDTDIFDENDFITAWIYKKENKTTEAKRLMKKIIDNNSSSRLCQILKVVFNNNSSLSNTTANQINEDDIEARLFLFLFH